MKTPSYTYSKPPEVKLFKSWPRNREREGVKSTSYTRRYLGNVFATSLGDGIAWASILLLAGGLRLMFWDESLIPAWSIFMVISWWVGAIGFQLTPGWGVSSVDHLRRTVLLIVSIFAGAAIFLFVIQEGASTSRFTLLMAFVSAIVLVPFFRMNVKRFLIQWGKWGVPVAVYGEEKSVRMIISRLLEDKSLGYIPEAVFLENPSAGETEIKGVPVRGGLTDWTPEAAIAILTVQGNLGRATSRLIEGSLSSYRRVMIIPDLLDTPSLWISSRDLGGVVGLEVPQKLLDPFARFTKRTIDLVAVIATMPVWLPLCGILAIAIWLEDRRAPLFGQTRVGLDRANFTTWKFRTMVPNAEEILRKQLAEDEAFRVHWEAHYKMKDDIRITRVGRWLRKTSLDELPQLINVFWGEMSLVGPRPLPAYHHQELPEQVRHLRERVRPGMTGLWQVSGRSEAGNDGIVRWDSYYVRNWSFWLDVIILVRTIRVVLKGSGAY